MKALVIVPTYNERENVERIVARLLEADERVSVLVVDDNSPDGTGEIAQGIADASGGRVRVLRRSGKLGLGTAYLEGFDIAIEHGYDVACEFDADGSHQPEDLPRLLAKIDEGYDLVIGARWVKGGKTVGWPWYRKLISRGGTLFSKIMLGAKLHDITAGFRAYPTRVLRELDFKRSVHSLGYAFQVETAWITERRGYRIAEVPTTFIERELGASKMSTDILIEAMIRVFGWGLGYRASRLANGELLGGPSRKRVVQVPGQGVHRGPREQHSTPSGPDSATQRDAHRDR